MEKIDIILWVMSGGFGLMLVMWHSLNARMDKTDGRMDKMDARMDRFEENFNARFEAMNANFNARFEAMNANFNARFEAMNVSFNARFDKLEEKVTDIDRRICRLEGAFASKDCCMIKNDSYLKKAE